MSETDRHHAHRLDEQIRKALEPDAGAVQRVVAGALATDSESHRPRLFQRLVVAPVMVLVIGAAIVLLRSHRLVSPESENSAPVLIVVKAERAPVYCISNIGDVITITKPNGQVQAIVSGGTS